MGAEDSPKKQSYYHPPSPRMAALKFKLKIAMLVLLTNLITLCLFSSAPRPFHLPRLSLPIAWDAASSSSSLVAHLNSTFAQLAATHSRIADLHRQLASSNSLVESLLVELAGSRGGRPHDDLSIGPASDGNLPDELKLAVGPHKLPLGHSPRVGSDVVHPPVGAACLRFKEELAQYMSYDVGGECPTDDVFAQRLLLKGCEPLPRRRCHPKSPAKYAEPTPFPQSLWTTPPDSSVVWDAYTCKSYKCLIDRNKQRGYFDCKDCFDLQGREKHRWMYDNGNLDYGIDQVLATRPRGTVRIGLDIGGGSGTFAARMRERNVTIVTTTMNLDGPFNSFIASRGLISMHMSVSQRLPFFENTLDIVHSMHVLSNWIPEAMLEFALYDVYRVLRPGGLFWLDHFFCEGPQLNGTYEPMIGRVGFKKVRWNAGRKVDRGPQKNEWYFSALLEKPMT
ncbi:probable methyltransferase At1g29790 [Rhodamnia argentea]|uniref:Probable methyltransferase At1g29790 n=1 Tax=Rhodamnia argentea TaxID=178133 RepID=A0A8B8R5C9_9MYRT|nr:probable methyltransferase At1g29790 [Rhodamnia argentea]